MEKPVLNYEEMVAHYWDDLNTVLRGFNADGQFWDLWVPDDDGVRSITNLVEAILESGLDALTLNVKQETASSMNLAELQGELVSMGQVKIVEHESGDITIDISGLAEGAAFHNVQPVYIQKLREAFKAESFAGELMPESGKKLCRAHAGALTLRALVDPAKGIIEKARYVGAENPLDQAILNVLCPVIEGLNIMEAADHGLLRFEDKLRDDQLNRPLPGIVIPESAEPSFRPALELLRGLLADYRQQTGFDGIVNAFVKPPSEGWRDLSAEDKVKKVQDFAAEFLQAQKIEPSVLHVLEIDQNNRALLSFESELDVHLKAKLIMQLERKIRKELEETVALYMEELKDRNVKRRQLGVGEKE